MILDVLRQHLVKSLNGGQAFKPFSKALEGIRPELRNVRPGEELHSVYEELEHMRIAQQDLLNYALEDEWESPEWPEGFWPKPGINVTDEMWKQLVDGFFSDLKKVVELVENEHIDLLSLVPRSKLTYLREIMIIIEHNAYHLGKILDIRKSLKNWN
jgi:hypothetical protein